VFLIAGRDCWATGFATVCCKPGRARAREDLRRVPPAGCSGSCGRRCPDPSVP
jgi:hypothetical protein